MMGSFQFSRRLKEKKPLIGTIQSLNSTEVTEIIISAGFDWIFVDLEHSPMGTSDAQRILQAAGTACPCIVRSPNHEEEWIKKILDTGAAGIIIPRVNTAEEAQQVIRLCKYPPEGCRSVGLSRSHGYGMTFKPYVENANRDTAIILQVEDIESVNNIESIVKVPGIDALFIGPYDLSGSMGKIGQVKDPEVQQQIEKVRTTCLKAGIALGIFTSSPEDVPAFIEKGFNLITVGVDAFFLAQSLAAIAKSVR